LERKEFKDDSQVQADCDETEDALLQLIFLVHTKLRDLFAKMSLHNVVSRVVKMLAVRFLEG
jgi:hypothetical protein